MRHTEESPLYRHDIESDRSIIMAKQMKEELGFKVETLFTSSLKINAHDVEDALQRKFQHLPLGCRLCVVQMQEQNLRSRMGKCTWMALFILTKFCH